MGRASRGAWRGMLYAVHDGHVPQAYLRPNGQVLPNTGAHEQPNNIGFYTTLEEVTSAYYRWQQLEGTTCDIKTL